MGLLPMCSKLMNGLIINYDTKVTLIRTELQSCTLRSSIGGLTMNETVNIAIFRLVNLHGLYRTNKQSCHTVILLCQLIE